MSATASNSNRYGIAAVLAITGVWAFWPTLAFVAGKWTDDPQYSHGFLVPVFSAFLLHRVRGPIAVALAGTGWPLLGGSILALALALRALAGGLLFHQLDALALLLTLVGAAVALGGFRLLKLTGPAILFLIFMVPLPYELERNVGGPLRVAATTASTFLLQACGLPAIAEGNVILIDEVKLGVVDACSGLKMLMTFGAFSVGAAVLSPRSGFEKLMVLLGIVPVSMLSNVLRITATGLSYTLTTDPATIHFLHDLYGWLMMPVGLGLLAGELWVLKRLVVPPSA